ncbi:LysR family transcriptional regulator [Lactiplantibacillus plantarum]|uniref:LysR family transcriptional regulator n=2 Tax=Lactiplantibacillus plantarum TaxID=1590 RepID=UPI001E594947|nr:LysR family transcriptional regulator [Lactiplantibacillus plantarum]MCC6114845.1 LysR family transcriptional regulator [Lactiplantibacillus plantarum]
MQTITIRYTELQIGMILMNFTQIECFVNVAETLNFSESAKKLHLSQPAVTKNIKQLEQELNVTLFNREKRGVSLTQPGTFFYRNMSDVMFRTQQTIDEMHSKLKEVSRYVAIGYTDSTVEKRFLPVVLREEKDRLAHVQLILHNFNLNSGIEELLNKKCDILLTTRDNVSANSKIKFIPMMGGHFNVILPKNHRLSKRNSLTISDLAHQKLVFFNTRQAPPEQTRMQNDIRKQADKLSFQIGDTPSIVVTLVKGQAGIGIVPSFIVDGFTEGVEVVPLEYPTKLTYGVAYLESNWSEELSDIIKIIQRVIKRMYVEAGHYL